MEFKTKEEWSAAVNKYKADNGTTRGFQPGKLQYVDSSGETWSYAAGTRGGPGHPRRASGTDRYTTRREEMEVDQTLGAETNNEATKIFNKAGKNAGVEKGVHQMHHMRTLNQFEPLLAGLEGAELEEALLWFKNEGFELGNLEGNLKKQFNNAKAGGTTIADTHQGTGSIHEYMRKHRLEPNTRQKEYKQMQAMFKGKSLNERLPMYVNYLEYVQGAVQQKLEVPTSYDWINNTRKQVGTIPSGPRAGQRLPVNRATLADAIIRDLQQPTLEVRGGNIKIKPIQAVRAARGLSPMWGSLPIGIAAVGMSGQSALANPTAETIEDVGWDVANLAADAATLIPTPWTVAGGEALQKTLGVAQQARMGQRELAKQEGLPEPIQKFVEDPLNELEYAGNQVMGFLGDALKMGSEAGY